MNTCARFSPSEIEAAKAAAPASSANYGRVDWRNATVTAGGGVAATISALRRTRGPNKRPAKEQVAYTVGSRCCRCSSRQWSGMADPHQHNPEGMAGHPSSQKLTVGHECGLTIRAAGHRLPTNHRLWPVGEYHRRLQRLPTGAEKSRRIRRDSDCRRIQTRRPARLYELNLQFAADKRGGSLQRR